MKARHFFYSIVFIFHILSCKTAKPVLQQQQLAQVETPSSISVKNTSVAVPVLVNDSNMTNAHIGIYIYEPATKKVIDEYQSNKYFIPASNTKIATCYAAMKYLGDSILGLMYDTLNMYGKDDSSINLIGTADPTFLHPNFPNQRVFSFIKNIKRSKIWVDEVRNPYTPNMLPYGKGWAWDDYDEAYMTERSFFPIYGNVVRFYLENEFVKVIPSFFQKKVFYNDTKRNSFKVNKFKNENAYFIFDNPGKNTTTSIIPMKLGVDEECSSYERSLLGDTTKMKFGISTTRFADKSLLHSKNKIYSQPTDSLLKPMMFNSDNFFAEQTLLMISLNQLGYMGDEQIIDTLLKRDFINLPQRPRWVDGSGLSRYNLFTPQDFVSILDSMKHNFSWNRITTIFPSGNQGTLKGYYKNYTGNIYAKTGSVSNSFSISGFLKTKSNKILLFSIMVNNYNAVASSAIRQSIERYVANIIESN